MVILKLLRQNEAAVILGVHHLVFTLGRWCAIQAYRITDTHA